MVCHIIFITHFSKLRLLRMDVKFCITITNFIHITLFDAYVLLCHYVSVYSETILHFLFCLYLHQKVIFFNLPYVVPMHVIIVTYLTFYIYIYNLQQYLSIPGAFFININFILFLVNITFMSMHEC